MSLLMISRSHENVTKLTECREFDRSLMFTQKPAFGVNLRDAVHRDLAAPE